MMYGFKRFILIKFYNNGIGYFICRIENKIHFILQGGWTPSEGVGKPMKNSCAKIQLGLLILLCDTIFYSSMK